MKRFWRAATVSEQVEGWGISLDDRPLKTPARAVLSIPNLALAEAIAAEWNGAGEAVDPRAMPLTGFANAAIDQVAPNRATFAETLARYAEADLLCYRADSPAKLVLRQAEQWDPLLAWARRRFDVDFVVTSGVIHVAQPAATIERLGHAVHALDALRLAPLAPLVTIGGSLVTALALIEEAIEFDTAWNAVSLDEQWQIEQWGADDEAVASLAGRKRDVAAAKAFLDLL